MKVLFIAPMEHPKVIDIGHTLTDYYKLLDCDCITAVYPWEDPVALVTDDEGLFKHNPFSRYIKELKQPIKGSFFLCGLGEEDFADLPESYIKKYMERFWRPEDIFIAEGKLHVVQFGL